MVHLAFDEGCLADDDPVGSDCAMVDLRDVDQWTVCPSTGGSQTPCESAETMPPAQLTGSVRRSSGCRLRLTGAVQSDGLDSTP